MYIFVRMKIKQGKSTHNAADALSRKNKSDMRISVRYKELIDFL